MCAFVCADGRVSARRRGSRPTFPRLCKSPLPPQVTLPIRDLQRGPSPPPASFAPVRLTTVRCLLGRYTLTVPTARDGSAPLAGGPRGGSMEPRTLSRRAEAGLGRCHGAPRTQEGFRGPVMTVWKQSGRDKKQIQSPGPTSPLSPNLHTTAQRFLLNTLNSSSSSSARPLLWFVSLLKATI